MKECTIVVAECLSMGHLILLHCLLALCMYACMYMYLCPVACAGAVWYGLLPPLSTFILACEHVCFDRKEGHLRGQER